MTRQFAGILAAASLYGAALVCGQAPPPATTIQANTNLVVVDVVVTDTRNNPVHNLTAADFTVLENGHPQAIKTFEEHTAAEAAAPLPAPPKLPPGTFTNYTPPAPANGALNILLLDRLNTPMTAQSDVRNQTLKFLKEAHPGMSMAIFGLNTRLVLLQSFTSDPELLRSILDGKKGLPKGSAIMTDTVNGDSAGVNDQTMDDFEEALSNDPSGAELLDRLRKVDAETKSFQLQLRAKFTLDALNNMGRYLSRFPGRKNLIWFSGSFPLNIEPDGNRIDPLAISSAFADEFRETVELLARSQVAVYPIDARGIMTEPAFSAAHPGPTSARALVGSLRASSRQAADEHSTMRSIAEATGGEAYVNTNGLKEAIANAVERGSHYYTLTYSPTDQKWNGKFRKIHVNGSRSGLTLAYRRGYYADDPNLPPPHGKPASAASGTAPANSAFRTAMLHGKHNPSEIVFAANVRPATADTETGVAPGNKPAAEMTGPYRRYTVQIAVNPNNLAFTVAPDGARHSELQCMIFVYSASGVLLNSRGAAIHANSPTESNASPHGIRFTQDISVPVNGEFFLRIGVRDATTDKVGAIELPVAAVSNLPPLAVAAAK